MPSKSKSQDAPADISELATQAQIVADATGRDGADVLADLLDDGIVNNSHISPEKDLVTQLKEAAELITTVQSINSEVSQNSVLNGGDNKTNVKVETTLEGDIVDRAIESVNRKVQNIKKIVLVILPVFLILTGGTLEGLGLVNMFGDDENNSSDPHDEYYNEYGGCLNYDAMNYDSMASWDDGTCQFDDNPPPCNPKWEWSLYGELRQDNTVWIDAHFEDMHMCYIFMDAEITMTLHRDGAYYGERVWNNGFDKEWSVSEGWPNLPEGEYNAEIEVEAQGSNWHQNVDGLFVIEEEACTPDYSSSDSWAIIYDNNSLEVHMKIINHNGCESNVGVMVSFYKENGYQDSYDEELGEYEVIGAETEIVIRHDDWTNLEDANYSFETRFFPEGQGEECCEMTPQIQIDTYVEPEPEPEPCEINLFNIQIGTNATHASVGFDLDCGYESNDLEGYNVTIQFLVYDINSTNSSTPYITYEVSVHYIQGWVSDNNYLTLTDFVSNNTTHYDFYWYAMWTDGKGEQQIMEEKWLNREMNP